MVPARRIEPRRFTSAVPVQRTNHPASMSTDCERWVSSWASFTVGDSRDVIDDPTKAARLRAPSSVRPESLWVPPAPEESLSASSVCIAVLEEGRMTSQEMCTASTVAAGESLRVRVEAGAPSSAGGAKNPVRTPGLEVQKTRKSFPLRRARERSDYGHG